MQRTCSKCGWLHPSTYTDPKCKMCKEFLPFQPCSVCGQWLPIERFTMSGRYLRRVCRECYVTKQKDYYKRNPHMYERHKAYDAERTRYLKASAFEDWCEQLRGLPTLNTLSEQEWQQACRFFRGCALCGEEHIEIRTFFIRPKDGGAYNRVNIFPTCVKCGTQHIGSANPFSWVQHVTTHKYFPRLMEYLQSKIEEVKNGETKHD